MTTYHLSGCECSRSGLESQAGISLVIATASEVENGIDSLWKRGKWPDQVESSELPIV
jgi:hypothetical protein